MYALLAQPVSHDTVVLYWWISLVIGLAVIVVVALLLLMLARTVDQINAVAAEIWRVGKLIANNTVHIPLLVRTNQVAGEIVRTADDIAGATARIERAVTGQPPDAGEVMS